MFDKKFKDFQALLNVAKSQKVFSSHFQKNEGNHFYFNVNKKVDVTLILFI